MSVPILHQFFNEAGEILAQRDSGIRMWFPDTNGAKGKNESLGALFNMVVAIKTGNIPPQKAQEIVPQIHSVSINNGTKFTLQELVDHVKSGTYEVGQVIDYQAVIDYSEPEDKFPVSRGTRAIDVIAETFPIFR